jgi:hypothetical protein
MGEEKTKKRPLLAKMATAAGRACGPMPERGRFDDGGKWIVHSSSLQDYKTMEDYEFDLSMVDMYGASCVAPSPRDFTPPSAIPKTPLQTNALLRSSPGGVELIGIYDEERGHETTSAAWTSKVWTPSESASSTPTLAATTSKPASISSSFWVPSSFPSPSIIPSLNLASSTGESWTESHGDQPLLSFGYRPSEESLVYNRSAGPFS